MTLGVLAALAVLGGTAPAWADASNAAPLAAGLSDSERAAMREQIKRNKGTITSKRDKDGKFRPED